MDNNIYIALSRQLGLFRQMDSKAQNIANATTTGYNAEQMMFTQYLVDDGNQQKMAFSQDIASYRDTSQGPLKVTGGPLDVAIKGRGYFTVETPLGERYTRAGSFQIDPEGTLITPDGYPVLDTAGQRIQLEENDRDILIGEAGNISVRGEERGQIGVVEFDNEQLLVQQGSGLFKADAAPAPAERSTVVQGALESSNVQPVMELTQMLQVSRSVGNTAKYIETMYDLERRASNTLARDNN